MGTSAIIASLDAVVVTMPGTPCHLMRATLQAPSLRSPPSYIHGKDCLCSRGGNFKNPGGSASSILRSVTTPHLKKSGTPSTALASTTGGSNPPLGCLPAPTSLATFGSTGALGFQGRLTPATVVGTSVAIASPDVGVVTTPGTPSNVVREPLQAPSFRSPPSHTHGKDSACNKGGNFKNSSCSASFALASVTTPQLKDTSIPSTALASTSSITNPRRTPTASGSNPPVPCSAPLRSSATIGTATAVGKKTLSSELSMRQ